MFNYSSSWDRLKLSARLAQSVEHETLNLRVVGSSPTLGVNFVQVHQKALPPTLPNPKSYGRSLFVNSRICGLYISTITDQTSVTWTVDDLLIMQEQDEGRIKVPRFNFFHST